MITFYDQKPGTRIKRWDLGDNPGALGTTTHNILTIVIAPQEDPNYSALRDVALVTPSL